MRIARWVGGRGIAAVACAALLTCWARTLVAGPAEDAAREHAKRATAAYNLGQYAEAAAEFEAAYKLVLDPMLLFNVAQSQRLAGQSDKALTAYRAFLRTAPKGADRAQAEKWKAELERKLAPPPAAVPGPPPPAPAPAPPPPTPAASPSPAAAAPAPLPPPAAVAPTAPAAMLTAPVSSAPAPEAARPVYARWWLWALVGAAVAAGAGTLLLVNRDRQNPDCRGIQPCGSI